MKRFLFLLALILFLTACVPTPTSDLYSDAQSARATAGAAQERAEYQERFLTATAEAPIIRITETAAGLIAMQTQNSIDMTSTAILWTPTVTPTPTPNATQTKVFIDLAAEQKAIENNTARDNLVLEREKNNNAFWAAMGQVAPFVTLVLIAGGVLLAYVLIMRRQNFKSAEVDARGNVLPVLDLAHRTITDSDSNPNYRSHTSDEILKRLFELWLAKKFGYQSELPELTAPRQDAAKERDQITDLATRGLLPESTGETRERKKLATQQAMKQLSPPNMESRFRILDGTSSNLDVIDGEVIKVLDADWKEAEKK